MVAASTLYGGVKPKSAAFTTSGTWTRPTGVESVEYLLVGSGGGGRNTTTSANVGGGGGGENCNWQNLK